MELLGQMEKENAEERYDTIDKKLQELPTQKQDTAVQERVSCIAC